MHLLLKVWFSRSNDSYCLHAVHSIGLSSDVCSFLFGWQLPYEQSDKMGGGGCGAGNQMNRCGDLRKKEYHKRATDKQRFGFYVKVIGGCK